MYLLSFPRFWTLSIERFLFLFSSILNGVTLKTSNKEIRDFQKNLNRTTEQTLYHQCFHLDRQTIKLPLPL